MPKRLLLAASAALLFSSVGLAQQAAEPQEAKPSVQEPQEKKPDAFQYFFGRKEKKEEEKKEPEAAKAAEAPAEKAEPAAIEAPPPSAPAAPVVKAPEQPAPAPAKGEPQVDAFQYFFGRSAQPAPQAKTEEKEETERKPLDAFDYFFGKNGKAGSEEEPESPPPPRT